MMRNRKLRNGIAAAVAVLAIISLGVSIYQTVSIHHEYQEAADDFDDLRDIYDDADDDSDQTDDRDCSGSEAVIDPGLLALHEQNEDCVAWITIEGTQIDYPVMLHSQETDYYLHRNFEQEYSSSGCLYFAENCDLAMSDNLLIYGHHMNNGSMFGELENYKSQEFFEEHSFIHLETLTGPRDYQVIAAYTSPVYTGNDYKYYDFINASDKAEYDSYVSEAKKRALYDTGITASYGEQLLTLSTCEYSQKNGRMVVVAKQITEGGGVE